ncbi:uncharacterized protein [Spinacia oleracea]|uniref:Uncharacterized protein n=1 Tax=Spinacia oleracea TaxID=3562 RepID=A0ABM3QSR5_SPIOL|nr:uncharacterized protein LOC130462063 [Spinacia oleracea]
MSHQIQNQKMGKREEEGEQTVDSAMSVSPEDLFLDDYREVRFDEEGRQLGPSRYYSEQFWHSVTAELNQRVGAVGLNHLQMQQYIKLTSDAGSGTSSSSERSGSGYQSDMSDPNVKLTEILGHLYDLVRWTLSLGDGCGPGPYLTV